MAWEKVDEEVIKGYTRGAGKLVVIQEKDLGSSNKVFTYKVDENEGQRAEIKIIRLEYQASMVGGKRRIEIRMRDSTGDTIQTLEFDATIMAGGFEIFQAAVGQETGSQGMTVNYENLMEGFSLLPGQSIQILDAAERDPTGDDMVCHILGRIF